MIILLQFRIPEELPIGHVVAVLPSVNPVTGKKEIAFMSEAWEISTGKKHYATQQQAAGGKYSIDPDLTRYVQSVGKKLAKFSVRTHLPYDFVVLNDSTANAWALPGGKIAINRGLLIELHDEAELAARDRREPIRYLT